MEELSFDPKTFYYVKRDNQGLFQLEDGIGLYYILILKTFIMSKKIKACLLNVSV